MKKIKHIAIAGALSSTLLITGCGGSSSGDDTATNSRAISGTATAPVGAVAYFEEQSAFEVALNFFISPLAAAITGLDPVSGATVELIRVDNSGAQVGDVLATTATSITGDYTLTLPEGVNLAGNLVVRISGSNSALRAQVVERNVDISPVSEFVLRKFVNQGVALDQLVVSDIVKLSGRVEEFDITLSGAANLDAAYAALENEIGDFVENEVAVSTAPAGNAASIVGDYRNAAFSFGLSDGEGTGYGSFAMDVWTGDFTFADNGGNNVSLTVLNEGGAFGDLRGTAVNQGSVYYESETENNINETFPGTLTANGILSVSGAFEESIDGDFGWRYPPMTYNFSKVQNSGLFFLLTNEASVRYSTKDTNGDGIKDALDPSQKSGDEIFRYIEMFSRQPTAFSDTDLTGKFGRVYIESGMSNGHIELLTETNTLTFAGDGTFTYGASTGHRVSLSSTSTYEVPQPEPEQTGLPITITAEGDITFAGLSDDVPAQPQPADGFINDTFDFMAFTNAEGTVGQDAYFGQTLLMKLPTTSPAVTNNKYRMLLLAMQMSDGGEMVLSSSQFNTYVNMASETEGTVDGTFFEVVKPNLGGEILLETYTESATDLTASIDNDGGTTLTVADAEGTTSMDGFFNEGATLGIFTLRYADTGNDPDELGIVILVKTDN
ncbi:hypothetical protein [uncultured Marinobacter sp.]|uniref:hypothetical protein n=1 Tax=uncultured Marinobacter sp. TaxID=187379 RepID=UPI0026238F1D|nr:hypothetical protein [uncultured Marinobacter sp.]